MYMLESWFLCMARHLNVLYKCLKFHLNIPDGYQVIEPTRFCDRQTIKQTQGENINARVMVLVHEMSSERALQMYQVSLKYH